jgi:hypothetical protein
MDVSIHKAATLDAFVTVVKEDTNGPKLTVLSNHANTVSVEDNSRKRSYTHTHANMTVTETTSLHAWCRNNISERAVA